MNKSPYYAKKHAQLHEMCLNYLIENFNRFGQANKIKVSMQILSKHLDKVAAQAGQPSITINYGHRNIRKREDT